MREAYANLFREVDLKQATREDIYNYFVTHEKLGAEMATKATRFFTQICRFADVELPNVIPPRRGRPRGSESAQPRRPAGPRSRNGAAPVALGAAPFLLVITPEVAALDEDRLTALFEKIGNALRRAGTVPAALPGNQ